MPTSWLTHGDLRKALPLVPRSLHSEGSHGVSSTLGDVWDSDKGIGDSLSMW